MAQAGGGEGWKWYSLKTNKKRAGMATLTPEKIVEGKSHYKGQ
jgi:hypothetical protein